jgi:penicillin-binding protein 1A
LSEALALSLNTVAAELVMEIGPATVIDTAKRLGRASRLEANASIALGTSEVSLLELTAAYAPFANGGHLAAPHLIRRITTAAGDILYERQPADQPVVVAERELGMMNAMLRDVVRNGTGKAAAFGGWDVAGKTGTTDNSRDALFVGYSANLVTGVWYGNDAGDPMKKVTGGGIPAESFRSFMTAAHAGVPIAALPGNYTPQAEVAGWHGTGTAADTALSLEDRNDDGEYAPDPEAPAPRRRNLFEILFGRKGL